ncbi:hypothetical protein DSM3645_28467 [Blastopirellula marina DSM 3645]|uniref:Uncharacterized protein n=1 Tax=Blastopirellula marina DSM 3645 TaxID=314230 RepID=A3ZPB5_9BACT|nr:hypothetical protein DSM3645_28467 [Blastopirellula marina DSM 3645]
MGTYAYSAGENFWKHNEREYLLDCRLIGASSAASANRLPGFRTLGAADFMLKLLPHLQWGARVLE